MPLSAAYDIQYREGDLLALPIAADTRIFRGAMVQITTAGFVTAMTAATGLKFIGVAEETVDNRGGTAGARTIKVRCGKPIFASYPLRSGETWAATDYNAAAYADDDAVVSKTATGRTQVGVFRGPDPDRAGHVLVRLTPTI